MLNLSMKSANVIIFYVHQQIFKITTHTQVKVQREKMQFLKSHKVFAAKSSWMKM